MPATITLPIFVKFNDEEFHIGDLVADLPEIEALREDASRLVVSVAKL